MTRTNIIAKFYELLKEKGTKCHSTGEYELETFELCSNYGFDLAGSTIDKVVTEYEGHLRFYYNENTGDYDYDSEFNVPDLERFFNSIDSALTKETLELAEETEELKEKASDVLAEYNNYIAKGVEDKEYLKLLAEKMADILTDFVYDE